MKTLISGICLFCVLNSNAQLPPLLDYTWTIEQIDTGSQIITADLNPYGVYDTFTVDPNGFVLDNMTFYVLVELIFGHCEGYYLFNDSDSSFLYHLNGCLLSNDDSSQIALYFNNNFIQQNTNIVTIDNDFIPNAYGPLDYSFTTIGVIIYMDITNSIGEVARFSASTLTNKEFSEKDISIYPNPVKDFLHMGINNAIVKKVEVYDLQGRLVLSVNNNFEQLNVSSLSIGVYVLQIHTDKGMVSKKLVKT